MDGLQFKINNEWVNAYDTYGIMMGDGFLDALLPPVGLKPFVTNKSRLIDGERVVVSNIRKESRTVTLSFTIGGNNPADFRAKKEAFYAYLYTGRVDLRFDPSSTNRPTTETFHFTYNGESSTYGEDLAHTSCKISIKLKEFNPNNRV